MLQCPKISGLDPGEPDLFAYLEAQESPLPRLILVSAADKGAIASMKEPAGWTTWCRWKSSFNRPTQPSRRWQCCGTQYCAPWLASIRTQVFVGAIP